MATQICFGKFHPDLWGNGLIWLIFVGKEVETTSKNLLGMCICVLLGHFSFPWIFPKQWHPVLLVQCFLMKTSEFIQFLLRFELDVWNSLFSMNWCWIIPTFDSFVLVSLDPTLLHHLISLVRTWPFLVYHKNLFRTDSSSTLWSAGSLMVDSGHHSFGFRYLHSLKLTRHLKIGHPKRNRVFQASIFRCKLLVSGRVYFNQSINLFFPGTPVTRPNVKHPEQNVWNATIPMILHPGPPTQPPQGCRPTLSLRCRRFVEWREASLTCIS